jgi:hypothetical protein
VYGEGHGGGEDGGVVDEFAGGDGGELMDGRGLIFVLRVVGCEWHGDCVWATF